MSHTPGILWRTNWNITSIAGDINVKISTVLQLIHSNWVSGRSEFNLQAQIAESSIVFFCILGKQNSFFINSILK